jgi:hypothetical protein
MVEVTLIPISQVAKRWSCPEREVYNAIQHEVLPIVRLGKMIRVPVKYLTDELRDRCLGLKPMRVASSLGRRIRAAVLANPPFDPDNRSRVYFFRSGKFVKVGYAKDVSIRIAALASSSPNDDTELLGSLPGDNYTEREVHKVLKEYRHRHEWFCLSSTLKRAIWEACDAEAFKHR